MEETTFNYILLCSFCWLPALIGGGYLFYCSLSFLLRKFFLHKKNKKVQKLDKKKKLFYHLWLPLIIGGLFSLMPIILGLDSIKQDGILGVVITFLSVIGLAPFFWIFYLIYHLVYWLITKLHSGKYDGGMIFRNVFLVSVIIMFLCLVVMLKGVRL